MGSRELNQDITRGAQLLSAGTRFGAAPGMLSRLIAPGFDLIIKRIDAGLERGSIHACLPDGTTRVLGGRADGFDARIDVKDWRALIRLATHGSIGWYQAYEAGEWDSEDPVALFAVMGDNARILGGAARPSGPFKWAAKLAHRFNRNSRAGSKRNIAAHYDLGNDFFKLFLDDTMTYSAGIFPTAESTLQEASETKLDRLIAKLGLGPDDHLLEIGTGWGSMSIRAARTTGCRVTTTTISREQAREARERVTASGLQDQITILETDYRDLQGTFDGVVAVEMIEAVGHRFLPTFFQTCSERLKPEGRLVLQAIAMPDHRYARYLRNTDFIREVVFPGSCCPSVAAMNQAVSENTDLKLTHLEDMAPHYAMTLHRWRVRFNEQLDQVRELGLDDQFIRMWDYYLSYCEAGFAEDYIRSVQMVYERNDNRVMTSLDPMPELETTS